MLPAKPPLPTPRKFPYQPSIGSQTSNLISESLVGLITPTTLRKAGKPLKGSVPGNTNAPAGGLNAPAATVSTETIAVFGSLRSASGSRVCAVAVEMAADNKRNNEAFRSSRLCLSYLLVISDSSAVVGGEWAATICCPLIIHRLKPVFQPELDLPRGRQQCRDRTGRGPVAVWEIAVFAGDLDHTVQR